MVSQKNVKTPHRETRKEPARCGVMARSRYLVAAASATTTAAIGTARRTGRGAATVVATARVASAVVPTVVMAGRTAVVRRRVMRGGVVGVAGRVVTARC